MATSVKISSFTAFCQHSAFEPAILSQNQSATTEETKLLFSKQGRALLQLCIL
jgi:hypothetical protein